jgi:hypothetical protein
VILKFTVRLQLPSLKDIRVQHSVIAKYGMYALYTINRHVYYCISVINFESKYFGVHFFLIVIHTIQTLLNILL